MAARGHVFLLILILFTLTQLAGGSLDLDHSDHNALRTLQKQLTINPQLRPQSPCNPRKGIVCEFILSVSDTYALRVTRVILESQQLGGFLSPVIGQLSELKELTLPNNSLVNQIPSDIANCQNLAILSLRDNQFSGPVPSTLSSLTSLRELDLSSNKLSGNLNFLADLPNLEKLCLSNNLFTGKLPASLQSFPNLGSLEISRNEFLIPEDNTVEVQRRVFAQKSVAGQNSAIVSGHPQKVRKTKEIVGRVCGVLTGTLAGIITVLGMLPFIVRLKLFTRKHVSLEFQLTQYPMTDMITDFSFLKKENVLETMEVIGRGSSGAVYKYTVENVQFAIKMLRNRREGDDDRIVQDFQTFTMVRHRNILSPYALVSLSKEESTYFVITFFIKNGSLENMLFQARRGTKELDWAARYKIAVGVAKGLEHLHTSHSPRIIHRDIKPANVLLDDEMEAKITDFDVALPFPEHMRSFSVGSIQGTAGYIAPECGTSLMLTDKCDIFSFGVLLAVLVTGKFPHEFPQECSSSKECPSLVEWTRGVISEEDPDAANAIDQQLRGNGCEEQMLFILKISFLCTLDNPQLRPNITNVMDMFSRLQGDIL